MSAHLTNLFRGLRHAVVAVAVLAVLVVNFRIHFHGEDHADVRGSGVAIESIHDATDDHAGTPCPVDPDGCGECHCPMPVIADAQPLHVALVSSASSLPVLVLPAVQPDGLNYPPDPPPARLN